MLVQLGPLPARSVVAWVGYAREVLAEMGAGPDADLWLPQDVVAAFTQYLDRWEAAAATDPFHWSGEVDADEAEYLSHAFFRIATFLARRAEERGAPAAPEEGEAFYRALVDGFLGALEVEGASRSEFSEYLRSFWPGLES